MINKRTTHTMSAEELKKRINELPSGYISMKRIKGKEYPYYQWNENGKIKSRYLKKAEYAVIREQIENRKSYQQVLKGMTDLSRYDKYRKKMLSRHVPIGIQDYEQLMTENLFFVDKTRLIAEWWNRKDSVTLITRPRRFGKTLNLSMLTCFFSQKYEGRSDLFKKTEIWEYPQYRKLQGTLPVINISLSGMKASTYESNLRQFNHMMAHTYSEHYSFLEKGTKEGKLTAMEFEIFCDIYKSFYYDTNENWSINSIKHLSEWLYRCSGKKVLLFIDEYDTPLQEAWIKGCLPEMTEFMRLFFHAALKENPYLERALLTGITRISKESFFSDLNHLTVASTVSDIYSSQFGFTEQEVFQALEAQGLADYSDQVKSWYDGFTFGEQKEIYNPWSIINYLRFQKFDNYWVNTSSNGMIDKMLQKSNPTIKKKLEDLLEGKSVRVTVREDIIFADLESSEDVLWNLLLASGYLRLQEHIAGEQYTLSLTNLEVHHMLRYMIANWFTRYDDHYNPFIKAMLRNDLKEMNGYMELIALTSFSFFDTCNTSTGRDEPERFYHGFVLGLIVDLRDRYIITSNRESGLGRYDITLQPRTDEHGNFPLPGIIIEFKVQNKKEESSLEDTVSAALMQICDKHYEAQLLEAGLKPEQIHKYGMAFCGKEVLIGGQ